MNRRDLIDVVFSRDATCGITIFFFIPPVT